jgi:hypothetical protein
MFGPIEQFWDDPWYSEVVQLYVGFLSLNQMGAANEIVERVLTADDQKPFNKWRLAAKAFENIHKDRREADVLALAQKRLLYVMHSDAEPKHRAEAGETLGWLGDPRDLKEFIPVTGGEYNLSLGKCMIEPFELGKYPVTNGWFREFVEAGGYKTGRYWTEEGKKWLAHTGAEYPRFWRDRKWNCRPRSLFRPMCKPKRLQPASAGFGL